MFFLFQNKKTKEKNLKTREKNPQKQQSIFFLFDVNLTFFVFVFCVFKMCLTNNKNITCFLKESFFCSSSLSLTTDWQSISNNTEEIKEEKKSEKNT